MNTYDLSRQDTKHGLGVEVVGYHMERGRIYYSDGGLDNYRIMMFHTPMPVMHHNMKWTTVEPHTVTVFNSALPSSYGSKHSMWDHSWLRITGSSVPRLMKQEAIKIGAYYPLGTPEEFEYWLRQINREAIKLYPNGKILKNLVCCLLSLLEEKGNNSSNPHEASLQKICRFIHANCTGKVSLDNLVELSGYSKPHFCALFKKHTGISPLAYVNRQRLLLATQLLENKHIKIWEVASECGFYDVYHFSRAFKKEFGVNPTQYRG